jgi:3-methyl-2-oxobutanoate hydroxymethyltransferase
MNILEFAERKKQGRKISMITSYDYWTAKIIAGTNVDCVLVGDSASMIMHGHPSTLQISTEMLAHHTQAVVKGCPNKFVVGDLPFLSYRKSLTENMNNMEALMKAGAHSLKLEGAAGNTELIKHAVQSGIPIMGHLGLTPQSVNLLGGFKVQAREKQERELLKQNAVALQDAGCFALVLECVPDEIASEVTQLLSIPTIGIGAGIGCDGQVLVLQDMLGMNPQFKPKFLRTYLDGASLFTEAINHYVSDVTEQKFPNQNESYK